MKSLFIAGNWKSNKTITEASVWLEQFKTRSSSFPKEVQSIHIVLCVPFTLLPFLNEKTQQLSLPLVIGAQDVSPFPDGSYTGAISARMIRELADWVIIGHSERRNHFGETDEILMQKVRLAKEVGLKVIYCVPDDKTSVPPSVDVVAYEPVWAIGTGKTDTPENASNVVTRIKRTMGTARVIYGGSVTGENVSSFVSCQSIDGVLPGGASLDPEKFYKLIEAASLAE